MLKGQFCKVRLEITFTRAIDVSGFDDIHSSSSSNSAHGPSSSYLGVSIISESQYLFLAVFYTLYKFNFNQLCHRWLYKTGNLWISHIPTHQGVFRFHAYPESFDRKKNYKIQAGPEAYNHPFFGHQFSSTISSIRTSSYVVTLFIVVFLKL